ncbi:L,D-transpeptidase family protein [Pseudaminobacter sp. 19-2017]|uniref:L,D-transpeptidase family protein n=2 Tax=Pseudaminobacter soli (ex Zhang et al. 2022) TaxID=2831468 RepID=A0A942DZB8_9HYPH|nr:L,D-transpeptidase family protein [Pseudaminobacter soli]
MRSYSKISKDKRVFQEGRSGLTRIIVRQKPGVPTQGIMQIGSAVFPCALGRGGISADKREGDGATPLARMRLLEGYFRGDHGRPGRTRLPMRPIRADLGWCEVPGDRNYNRPVKMPYEASHETMRREDRLYDFCIVLDWNIRPRRPGRGSAIFFHLARLGFTPTEGCVAVTRQVMLRLLPHLTRRTVLEVRR